MTIGNHEPDFDADVLRERMRGARFPVVAANLIERASGRLFTDPFVLRRVGRVMVGILGLAYPKTARTTASANVRSLEFQDPVPAVRRYLPAMRAAGAQLTLVLSHLGLGADQHLARAVAGIDVIVGGHSHNRMTEAERVGNTLIVQAGAHGSDLGRLDLVVANGRITGHQRTLIPLDHARLAPDAEAARLVAQLLRPHRAALDEEIGQAAGWLIRAQTLAGQPARKRDEESPVDSLFADILRTQTRADVALLPGVGYGVAIPPGPITAAQLRQLLPHNGQVVTMRLSGTQIVETLEQAVENTFTTDPAVKVGGMIQLSGLRFRYNPGLAPGHRVLQVARAEGRFNEAADYTVATSSMLAHGGHNYAALRQGREVTRHGSQYEAIKRWFMAHAPIAAPPPGRIAKDLDGQP